jgi:hypothetical protein
MCRRDDDEELRWFTWVNTWAAKVMDMNYMEMPWWYTLAWGLSLFDLATFYTFDDAWRMSLLAYK